MKIAPEQTNNSSAFIETVMRGVKGVTLAAIGTFGYSVFHWLLRPPDRERTAQSESNSCAKEKGLVLRENSQDYFAADNQSIMAVETLVGKTGERKNYSYADAVTFADDNLDLTYHHKAAIEALPEDAKVEEIETPQKIITSTKITYQEKIQQTFRSLTNCELKLN